MFMVTPNGIGGRIAFPSEFLYRPFLLAFPNKEMRGVILVRRFLASEEFSGFLHSLRNGHTKRAARFTGPASNAFGRGMRPVSYTHLDVYKRQI